MKGRFQPTTVGNMVKCDDGGYVCVWDYQQLEAKNAALREQLAAAQKDAERYRWLRNPTQGVALVIDKVTGEVPADEFGCGGYKTYEYRAGAELDAAIDAAITKGKQNEHI